MLERIRHIASELQKLPELADILQQWEAEPFGGAPSPSPLKPPEPDIQQNLAAIIDHTLLKPEAQPAHIATLCQEAREYHFASVCINPRYVAYSAQLLAGSAIAVCTVVGFPLGATTTETKVFAARQACQNGAREVDMVLPIGQLKAQQYREVFDDIQQVVRTCHTHGSICKVILETALLNEQEKIVACLLAIAAHADFVKTSTGFSSGGASLADVTLMRQTVGPSRGVKASGGIRTLQDAQAMVEAGANRIGTSSGVQIVREQSAHV
jgi:deoxyribose-phosphate aldolase